MPGGEGVYFLRARYYQPSNGRFVSQDPWQGDEKQPLSLNKYAYVSGDSINFVDPGGMMLTGALMSGYSGLGSRIQLDVANLGAKAWATLRILTIAATIGAVSQIPGDSSEWITVYRFGDMMNPKSWIPNLFQAIELKPGEMIMGLAYNANEITRAKNILAQFKKAIATSTGFRELLNEFGASHMQGGSLHRYSPFLSVTVNPEGVLNSPDPDVQFRVLPNSPHIVRFRVPKRFLMDINPAWRLSGMATGEGEKFYTGHLFGIPLMSFWNAWVPNPRYRGLVGEDLL
jgi:RHS repeat-associated protein